MHELPGRLRFSLRVLRRDSSCATALRDQLGALPGVATATASALTGSVLVTHDGSSATRERILRTVDRFERALSPECSKLPEPLLRLSGDRTAPAAHPLVRAIIEKLLERVLGAAIAAII